MAWVSIAVAAIGSYADSRDKDKDRDASQRDSLQTIGAGGFEGRRTTAYEMELADYYSQLGKERKRKALSSFSKYANPGIEYDYQPQILNKPENPGLIDYAAKKPKGE